MSSHTKVAIIGSGPAGYTAGLYVARASLAPTEFTGIKSGGQLMWTTDVENYPGFPEGKKGPELMAAMRAQAEKFGTIMIDKFVLAVDFSECPFKIWTTYPPEVNPDEVATYGKPEEFAALVAETKKQPADYTADSIIIATGAVSIPVGVPGEKEFLGRGVSTCAVCDAAFFRDKVTYVVGGGDAAMEDTLALTKFAKEVTVIHRRDKLKASKIMQERVLNNPNVKMMWNTTLEEVMGEGVVQKIRVKQDGEVKELPADGVFVAIGHRPMTQIFKDQIKIDAKGYIVTRQSVTAEGIEAAANAKDENGMVTYPTMTSVEGVFAAGDVVDVRYKQAVTSAGQGSMAAIDAERWLEMNGK